MPCLGAQIDPHHDVSSFFGDDIDLAAATNNVTHGFTHTSTDFGLEAVLNSLSDPESDPGALAAIDAHGATNVTANPVTDGIDAILNSMPDIGPDPGAFDASPNPASPNSLDQFFNGEASAESLPPPPPACALAQPSGSVGLVGPTFRNHHEYRSRIS